MEAYLFGTMSVASCFQFQTVTHPTERDFVFQPTCQILAIAGALAVDRLGRRFLWLASTGAMLVCYILITGLSAGYDNTGSAAMGIAVIAFLFLISGAYDIAYTGLTISYVALGVARLRLD